MDSKEELTADVAVPTSTQGINLKCRMYEQKYPEVDDIVVVEVKSIEEVGAYVALKEYNDIEGMILLSELSKRRIRSINKIIRVGRLETVVVLRVDKDKGYIDLSKRRVGEEDIAKHDEKYSKSKTVHSIMRHVAETAQKDLEDVYQRFGWPLHKKYGHAFDAFKLALSDPDKILEGLEITPEEQDALLKNIKRRLTPQAAKVRADLEVTCFGYEGIDAIKRGLLKGEACSIEGAPVKLTLVAPPLYVAVTTATSKEMGIDVLNKAIDAIKQELEKSQGNVIVKVEPRTVHEREEKEWNQMMERLAKENQEVPGDDSMSEGEEDKE